MIKKLIMSPVYFIVGWYSYFIQSEYSRLFNKDKITDLIEKAAACSACVQNGSCVESDCGCDIDAVLFSDKKCPNGKW